MSDASYMLKELISKFKLFSDETRLKIYSLLLIHPDGLFVCEISSLLEVPFYNVSKHLKELRKERLIDERSVGKYTLYFPIYEKNIFDNSLINLIENVKDRIVNIPVSQIDRIVENRGSSLNSLCKKILV
jgi:DNA-binding transcriptional ArsR family regulator